MLLQTNALQLEPAQAPVPRRQYARPPVVEAVVEIRLPSASADLGRLAQVNAIAGVVDDYPEGKLIVQHEFVLDTEAGTTAGATQAAQGYRFESRDGARLLVARQDRFSFSQLSPYASWERVADEVRRLWPAYREIGGSDKIARLGVRYLNRVEMPAEESVDLKDYFAIYPELPADLDRGMSGMLVRFHLLGSKPADPSVTFHLSHIPSQKSDSIAFLLDIDVWRNVQISAFDEVAIWAALDELHDEENRVFEASIKDSARTLFGEPE
jgi:uncharacterized protein (TIGR04255 family)